MVLILNNRIRTSRILVLILMPEDKCDSYLEKLNPIEIEYLHQIM